MTKWDTTVLAGSSYLKIGTKRHNLVGSHQSTIDKALRIIEYLLHSIFILHNDKHFQNGGAKIPQPPLGSTPAFDTLLTVKRYVFTARTRFRLLAIAPDFTDTGDGDDGDDDDDNNTDDEGQRPSRDRHPRETADREERRADLFAGLGPVAVFSARHRFTRPRWAKVMRGGRHWPDGDDESAAAASDPVQSVDRWFGFELRSYGGGAAGTGSPATIGHVRSNSVAQVRQFE